MKTPFLIPAIAFAVGILLQFYFPFISQNFPKWFFIIGSLSLYLFCKQKIFYLFLALVFACAGFWRFQNDSEIPQNAIHHYISPEKAVLFGEIESLPEIKTKGKKRSMSFVLEAKKIRKIIAGNKWEKNFDIQVAGKVQVFVLQSDVLPQVGDEIRLYGILSQPREVLNPGEFDYEKFLELKKIRATFQAIGKKSLRILKTGNPYSINRIIAESRRKLAALSDDYFDTATNTIVKALVLGVRTDVDANMRSEFMKTGTIHLLAISGMNITMIAGTFFMLFLFLGLNIRFASWLALVLVLFYIGLAGYGIPIQRAGICSIIVLAGAILGRTPNLLNSLCFSFLLILLIMPQSLWNVGFQLSFLCVLSLIQILPFMSKIDLKKIALASSFAVLVGTFPVVIFYFNIFSPISIVANLLAIPLFDTTLCFAIFAILFGSVPILGSFFIWLTTNIVFASLFWVKVLARLKWGYFFLQKPDVWEVCAYYLLLILILWFFKRKETHFRKQTLAVLISLCLAVSIVMLFGKKNNSFYLTVLASGKSQVAHIHFDNKKNWLINSGNSFPSDQGEWLISPYLRYRGVSKLNGIIFTDSSKRNSGGIKAVSRDFSPALILRNDTEMKSMENFQILTSTQKGRAVLVNFKTWNFLIVPAFDAKLFENLSRNAGSPRIDVLFLPYSDDYVFKSFRNYLSISPPKIVVAYKFNDYFKQFFDSAGIRYVELAKSGALIFFEKDERVEMKNFREEEKR